MTTQALLTLALAWAVGLVSPGPDFLAVLRASMTRGRSEALMVGVGVVSAIACWIVLALTGLSVLLTRYPQAFWAFRLAGALFLLWMGLSILWATRPGAAASVEGGHGESEELAVPASPPRARSLLAAWRLGFLTNIANPKAVVFFGALFASLLPERMSTAGRVEVFALMVVMALAWFSLVAAAASTGRVVRAYQRAARAIDRVMGGLFTVLGAALIPR